MVEALQFHEAMPLPDAHQMDSLEQRVHRLEDAVAAMQDTRSLEERLVERGAGRINGNATAAATTTGIIIEAGRHLLPAALEGLHPQSPHADASPYSDA